MTKRDQIDVVAHAAGITTRQARAAIDAVGALITASLLEEERFSYSGLGTFMVIRRRPRRVSNPRTGVLMDLPAKTVVKFKPAPELRKRVEERHA